MKKTIVLTRPIAQAQSLATWLEKQLAAQNKTEQYHVALFPLLEVTPLPPSSELYFALQTTLARLSDYALAVFVSPNAVHAVFEAGINWPSHVAIGVVGEGSRAALAQYGVHDNNTRIYRPASPAQSDSEALLAALDLSALAGRKAVLFRALAGRELLADTLAAHGVKVDKVIAYQRAAPALTPALSQRLRELLSHPSIWVVSSSEALSNLTALVQQSAGVLGMALMRQINLWVTHPRIGEVAKENGFQSIRLIGLGDENLLLAVQSRFCCQGTDDR
jgi:uroporphyrinogen-III synthase